MTVSPTARREVESEYLPVFAAGVAAGAQGVMPSYNSIDGIPVAADKWLLTDILRTEWGCGGRPAIPVC